MAKAATAFVVFEGDFSKIQAGAGMQARGLESTFKSSFAKIAKFAKLALVGVGVGFGALGAFGLKAAGDFQQTRIAFEGILGSAKKAQTFLESLRKFAAKTPFEFPELATAAKSLLAVGFNANDVIPIMTRLGNVAATLGVGGEAINGVVRALGQMKGKGKASAEELNQISEQIPGFSGIKAIADAMGVSTAEAFKKMSTGAISADFAVDAILKGMEKFPGAAGAMERQSKTLNGVLSTFKDTMRDALINGIEPLLPAISSGIEKVAPIFGRALGSITNGIAKLLPFLKDMGILAIIAFKVGFGQQTTKPIKGWLKIFATVGVVIRAVTDFMREQVIPQFKRLVEFFQRNADTIKGAVVGAFHLLIGVAKIILPIVIDLGRAVAAIVGYFRDNVDVLIAIVAPLAAAAAAYKTILIVRQVKDAILAFKAAMIALNATFLANPVVVVVAAIVALGAAVFIAYKHFGPFHDAVDKVWQILQSTFHWVQDNWPLLLAILTGPFGLAIKFILDKFDGPKGLLEFVKKIPGRIAEALVGIWDGLTKGLAASFGVVERAFAAGVNAVIKIINGLIRAYNNTLGRIPGAPNIGTIDPVTFGITKPKAADLGIGAGGVPNSIRRPTGTPGDRDFIGPVSVAAAQGAPTVDARTVVMGNVYGDSHLRKILDDHDRELEQSLAVA